MTTTSEPPHTYAAATDERGRHCGYCGVCGLAPADHTPALDLFVPGTPRPQGSKRPVRNKHTGKIHLIEQSENVGTWREDIRQAVLNSRQTADQLAGPVRVRLAFVIARPKGHYRAGRNAHLLRDSAPLSPAGKPDIDKLARAVLDAIGSAGLWADDAQVVDLHAVKRYARRGDTPGAHLEVWRHA